MPHQSPLDHIAELVRRLPLPAKVRLLTAATAWRTHEDASLGLRQIVVSDGPSGVRGEAWDERVPSLSLPSATSLAAGWDEDAAERYGSVLADQARERGVGVVLGPTINLHRSPLGGRHFEAFSEDPLLTARIAVGYVRGLQNGGVGASPKHFVGNESESERFTVSAEIDERTLRELYLAPFEAVVREAGAWTLMSAYSGVNGVTMTENELLEHPLKDEWGFDGVVISDWGAVRSIESAASGQDVVFPGPRSPWTEGLLEAVQSGAIAEEVIDEKVRRILLLAHRIGALETAEPSTEIAPAVGDRNEVGETLLNLASAGMVLLRNERDLLPLDRATVGSMAVIGASALAPRIQGGGSATVMPTEVSTPLGALRDALPDCDIRFALGSPVTDGITPFPVDSVTDAETGRPGVRVRFLDEDGELVFSERRENCQLVWLNTAPDDSPIVEVETIYTPPVSGPLELGFAIEGEAWLWMNGELFHHTVMPEDPEGLGAGLLSPRSSTAPTTLIAGVPVTLRLRYVYPTGGEFFSGSLSLSLGSRPSTDSRRAMIEQAVVAAADSDVAVVVVGTSEQSESEGRDRTDLRLPGWQDELVVAVAAVNPRTIVVVNSGAPVELPWAELVPAVLATWFPGQEAGRAIADVLLGAVEPGGRLPMTWPVSLDDVPVWNVKPSNNVLRYDEGIHIGYRAWLRQPIEPQFPFGHGLGYTTWALGEAVVASTEAGMVASVALTNTGARTGSTVVQVYASKPESEIDRPVRWLVGFAKATLAPDESTRVSIDLPARQFAHWSAGWQWEPGEFVIELGFSSSNLRSTTTLTPTSAK